MVKSDSKIAAICDAGPIIHLDELNSLDLLSDFHPLTIPKSVQIEITKHRPQALQHTGIAFKVIEVVSPPEPKLLVLSKDTLKNSFSVIPEVFIGNTVLLQSTSYRCPIETFGHDNFLKGSFSESP